MERVAYDELGMFHENAAEYGIPYDGPPAVRRGGVRLPDGRSVSALVWGEGAPEVVLLHGTAMNAHTWDTVALALARPLVAIDLPGHGHSSWRDDHAYRPADLADDLAPVITALAPDAAAVVGMSLGGLTALALATRHAGLVRRLGLVDITPGVNRHKAKAIIDFVDGPQAFASFDDLLRRTMEHNPTRSESSLRRGILHNARQLDDGSWVWRYDRGGHAQPGAGDVPGDDVSGELAMNPLWDDLAATTQPLLLVRGGDSPVVDDEDVVELRRRRPDAEVVTVPGAGHSVQGDRPLELAALLDGFVPRG